MITRLLLGGVCALALWLVGLAGLMWLGAPAPAALVLLPPADMVAALPPDVRILSGSGGSLILASDGAPDALVAALYAAGAPLVLPAGLTGCLPLPEA